ncbi:MAG: bifunctional phosphopantothenoylcysteine decarboxylase/phosphopantothenate--cysteine ligase CoaBC [Anaerolineae bacterium]|nr:bifunctional phosphopantothenoylcysteine decarboxylase/phosphopantothenate--cysteine ligase CoaBC [Anaerolineae bacterium]
MFAGRNVVLCVTGGIAAYKAADLARRFYKAGARVDVVMTQAAAEFITPLTFQGLVHTPVALDMFQLLTDMEIGHVSLARRADVVVVAPATANTIAKLAWGFADNMVTATVLAAACPVVVAPAMNDGMWANLATQENVEKLRARGFIIVPPEVGLLAEGSIGRGRLAEPETIVGATRLALAQGGPLRGRRVLVTAGSTREPLDPVRFISNRSSGKMGYAIAQAALDLGADVTLISGPTHLTAPYGAQVVHVTTVADMRQALAQHVASSDVLVMAAAPVDYRAEAPKDRKVKKEETGEIWSVPLRRNPDLVAEVGRSRPAGLRVLVGFAAETEDLLANAEAKLRSKGLDLIAANDVSAPDAGFEVDTNRVTLLGADGSREDLPLMSKEDVARRIMEKVVAMLGQKD